MTVNNEIPSLICCPNCGHAYDITEQVISKIVDSEQKKVIEEQTKVVESLKIKESILDSNIKNQEKLLKKRNQIFQLKNNKNLINFLFFQRNIKLLQKELSKSFLK